MNKKDKILKLYFYWVNANDMYWLIRENSNLEIDGVLNHINDLIKTDATFNRLLIVYSLLYVVIEAFAKLKLDDATINKLLDNKKYVENLRRLRNATFHYQKNFNSEKVFDFINIADSQK